MPGRWQNAPSAHHRLVGSLSAAFWVGGYAVRSAIHIDEANLGLRVGIALHAMCQPRVAYEHIPRFELGDQRYRFELVRALQASQLDTWRVEACSALVVLLRRHNDFSF